MSSDIPPSWFVSTLEELATSEDRQRVPLPSNVRAARQGPYAYWGANGVLDQIDDFIFDGPRLLMAEDGTVESAAGGPVIHLVNGRYWVNNHAHVLKVAEGVSLRWLYYALAPVKIGKFLTGSVQPKLSQRNMNVIPLNTPPLQEQRRIAWVLGSLDDKIELNRRLARTLEEIAAAIFKARFIDFEGVTEFEDSEMGPIPTGWRAGVIGDVVDLIRSPSESAEACADDPYIGLDAMPRGSTVLWDWGRRDNVDGKTARFEVGDVLFGKLRPYFRKVGVAPVKGSCSTEILVLRAHSGYESLAAGHLASDRFAGYCMSVARGTRMPRAEWSDTRDFRVAIPDATSARRLGGPAAVIQDMVRQLIHETSTLASVRAALLPKLISGRVRVPEGAGPDLGPKAEAA